MAFEAIIEAVEGKSAQTLFFIDGPGGSGKNLPVRMSSTRHSGSRTEGYSNSIDRK